MPTYRLVVAYDGTAYHGWQKQPGLPTIEGTLQDVFQHTFKMPVVLLGGSRTDAGVHALGQIFRAATSLTIPPQQLLYAYNNNLPADILIRNATIVDDQYSPHAAVQAKIYYYHLSLQRPLPFIARYCWYYPRTISIDRLAQAFELFQGTHDFRSFCSIEDTHEDMVRTIQSIRIEYLRRLHLYRITITGERFLRHMVRRIVGAAITLATENTHYTIEDLRTILYNKNPHHPLPNAPANGLTLYRIIYHGVEDDD